MAAQARYTPLPISPELDDESASTNAAADVETSPHRPHCGCRLEERPLRAHDRLTLYALVGALLTSALSAILFVGDLNSAQADAALGLESARNLRRPTTYINIEKALLNASIPLPPLVNYPRVVLQAQIGDPNRRVTEDSRMLPSKYGTVYSDGRRIRVTEETSTILQFRNLDYGMERCFFTARIPTPKATFDPAVDLEDPAQVDIWFLEDSEELDPAVSGRWGSAPLRRELFTTLLFSSAGANTSREFRCPSGAFTNVEVTCSGATPRCRVDFWQDQRVKPSAGLYLTQLPS